jgi:hypothetical protein
MATLIFILILYFGLGILFTLALETAEFLERLVLLFEAVLGLVLWPYTLWHLAKTRRMVSRYLKEIDLIRRGIDPMKNRRDK